MAVPSSAVSLKSSGDLQVWLKNEVGPILPGPILVVPHGGTALTLLGIKESTKDVDLGFREERDFDRFRDALRRLGYDVKIDSKSKPSEHFLRFENAERRVDVVDIRFPTWNDWRLTKSVLSDALELPMGNVRALRLGKEVIFLFKTYPLRETDVADLRTVLDKESLKEERIISLFDDQDRVHRNHLKDSTTEHEPLINLLNLRTRFAASMELIGPTYRRMIPRVAAHGRRKFRELRLKPSLNSLIEEIRQSDMPVDWDSVVGPEFENLRARLAV